MFGMFGNPFEEDSIDYYDPYSQYYQEQRAEEQRRREEELRREQELQRQMYEEQIREKREEEEERRQLILQERLAHEAMEIRNRERRRLSEEKPRIPIFDTKEELYQARNSVPNRFEQGEIVNNEIASEPSDAFRTYDPNNVEEEVKMFAKDLESQKGFVRTGDVYSVSVNASSRAAATVEANAAGDLQIVVDNKKYQFKLPAYTDRSSIRAKWNNGVLLVQVDVPSNPEQDVFVVHVE